MGLQYKGVSPLGLDTLRLTNVVVLEIQPGRSIEAKSSTVIGHVITEVSTLNFYF